MSLSFRQPDTNQVTRLIKAFRVQPAPSMGARLDILLRLAQLDDARIGPLLLAAVADLDELGEVRINALKWLRDTPRLTPDHRAVAATILSAVQAGNSPDLRLQAAFTLEDFTDVDGVLTTLGGLALDPAELIDVRYAAFTSLEHGGPTPECVTLLGQLTADETFGDAARSLLSRWQRS